LPNLLCVLERAPANFQLLNMTHHSFHPP